MPLPIQITDAQIEEYEQAGAICLRGLFSQDWIERLRGAVDRAFADHTDAQRQEFQLGHTLAKIDADVRAFVFESPGAEIARQLMRSQTVRYYFDQLFVKEPGVQAATPWHNDQPYWPVAGRQICSIWLPLDPVTKANSGLEYVYGSHNWDKEFAPAPFSEDSAKFIPADEERETLPDFDNRRDEFQFLCWDMQPGDCLVHQARTIHGASGNTTRTHRRRAISVRWLGDDARYRDLTGVVDDNLVDPTLRSGDPMESLKFPLVRY